MNKFLVSEEAYNEFKAFLVENEVESLKFIQIMFIVYHITRK